MAKGKKGKPKQQLTKAEKKEAAKKEFNELRSHYAAELGLANQVNRKIQYLFGLVEALDKDICEKHANSFLSALGELSEEGLLKRKQEMLHKWVSIVFKVTSEYHWVDTGVTQREFDIIDLDQSIETEDEVLRAVDSIQGFNAYLHENQEFEEDMGESIEI
jgi:uncharacterized protein YecA (UPF0149 family)